MSRYSSFMRSIRVRYISGLLVIALAGAAIIYVLNAKNTYTRQVDRVGTDIVVLVRDIKNAANFAEQTSNSWRSEAREQLKSAAWGHLEKLNMGIKLLTGEIAAIKPQLSAKAAEELEASSINGDLFWTARDIVKNLTVLADAPKWDEWLSLIHI